MKINNLFIIGIAFIGCSFANAQSIVSPISEKEKDQKINGVNTVKQPGALLMAKKA